MSEHKNFEEILHLYLFITVYQKMRSPILEFINHPLNDPAFLHVRISHVTCFVTEDSPETVHHTSKRPVSGCPIWCRK